MQWLATSIVHAANARRPNSSGVKVGRHQASSASLARVMTTLWFDSLTAADRVSVKPHASPVLHALNFLLGRIDGSCLPRLREFGELQPYPTAPRTPSRWTTPPARWGSGRRLRSGESSPVVTSPHTPDWRRVGGTISLLGDAELDEGAVWRMLR